LKSTLAIAALVATTLGVGAVSSFAQEAASPTPAAMRGTWPGHGMMMGHGLMGRGMMGPGFLMLACADRGAEELDVALVRMSHRLELTAEQTKLFDALREKALTEATRFADACKAAMPAKTDADKPDLIAGIKAGLGLEEARLAALKDVLPAFEAFYDSLTDAQKAKLMPASRDGRMMFDRGRMFAPGRTVDPGRLDMGRVPDPGRIDEGR
jgi:hypothetical protein